MKKVKRIRLSLVLSTILASTVGIGFQGCADLNIEIQQTARTLSEAKRDPNANDVGDKQGSERMQGKSPTGVDAKANIANSKSETKVFGSDVSGEEK